MLARWQGKAQADGDRWVWLFGCARYWHFRYHWGGDRQSLRSVLNRFQVMLEGDGIERPVAVT